MGKMLRLQKKKKRGTLRPLSYTRKRPQAAANEATERVCEWLARAHGSAGSSSGSAALGSYQPSPRTPLPLAFQALSSVSFWLTLQYIPEAALC